MKFKQLKMIVFLLVLASSPFLTVQAHAQTSDTLAVIKSRGTLIMGADVTYAPFESIDGNTNMPVGFDVDLGILLAHNLGVNLTVRDSPWDPIISNLQQNQFDIILSAMTITSARAQEVDFTRWYYASYQAWLVPQANPKGLNTLADLNQTGLKVGVQVGSTADLFANQSLPNAEIHRFADVLTAVQAVSQGSIDVVLGDWYTLQDTAQSGSNFIIPGTFAPEYFGIAVRKGDTNLLNALNTILDNLLGTNRTSSSPSDQYNSMYFNWFGVNAPDYNGTGTPVPLPTDVTLSYDQVGASTTTTTTTTSTLPSSATTTSGSSSSSGSVLSSSSKATITHSTPGFEFLGIIALIVIPCIRKVKKS